MCLTTSGLRVYGDSPVVVICIVLLLLLLFCISSNEPVLRGRDCCYQVAMKVVSYLIFME